MTERPLWDANDPSEQGRRTDVNFRVGRCGRFEWTVDGEDQYVQFLPPFMADLSMPAEVLARSMDYAGIETAVLQNDKIYGNLAEDFAAAALACPAGSSAWRRWRNPSATVTSSSPCLLTRWNGWACGASTLR